MSSARWRQIVALFEAALRIDSSERGEWLRFACGADDDLKAEVGRLLARDAQVSREERQAPRSSIDSAPIGFDHGVRPHEPSAKSSSIPYAVTVGPAEPASVELTLAAGGFTP